MKNVLAKCMVVISLFAHLYTMAQAVPDARCGALCGAAQKITDQEDLRIATKRIDTAFEEQVGGGRVFTCSVVFKEYFGRGFSGVGGACVVELNKKKTNWLICTSDGINNFFANTSGRFYSIEHINDKIDNQIVQMIQERCIGG